MHPRDFYAIHEKMYPNLFFLKKESWQKKLALLNFFIERIVLTERQKKL